MYNPTTMSDRSSSDDTASISHQSFNIHDSISQLPFNHSLSLDTTQDYYSSSSTPHDHDLDIDLENEWRNSLLHSAITGLSNDDEYYFSSATSASGVFSNFNTGRMTMPLTPEPNSSQLGSPAPERLSKGIRGGVTSIPASESGKENGGGNAGGTSIMAGIPHQIEKRRAQNRNSQRAFRKRRASYINELEQELEEVRGKYKELLGCFLQMKVVFNGVASEAWVETEITSRGESVDESTDGFETGVGARSISGGGGKRLKVEGRRDGTRK